MIRGATLMSMMVGSLLAVFVFALKYEVQDLETDFLRLSRSIDDERQAIHVLTAEWSHLNEPERLRELAKDQLDLQPVLADNLGSVEQLPFRHPGDRSVVAPLSEPGAGPPGEASYDGVAAEDQFMQIQAAIAAMKSGEAVQ